MSTTSISLLFCSVLTLLTWTGAQPVAQAQYNSQQNLNYNDGNYADNGGADYNNQPAYASQRYTNTQPQPQYQQTNQNTNQYDERTNHALNNGEYIGDGDYHGEGLQESGAFDTQNGNSQSNYDYNNNNNYNSNNDRSSSQGSQAAAPDYGYSFEIAVGK